MLKNYALLSVTSMMILSGCVPTTAWYKGSVTQKRANSQLTECQVNATKDVPTSIEKKVTGGILIGYIYIPTTSDVDTNDQLRNKVVAQCMTNRGYQPVELPVCQSNVPMPDMDKRAVISNKSCYKPLSGGYFAIATKK